MIILRLIWESLSMAIKTFLGNKLRSILTLLGITIGIFSIIAVFTAVDSLEINIRNSISALGDKVIYIQKWPWTPEDGGQEYPWWKYLNRPQATLEESEIIKEKSRFAEDACFAAFIGKTIKYGNNRADDVMIQGVTNGFENIRTINLMRGRYFLPFEINQGKNIVVMGSKLASELFEDEEPIGKKVKIGGFKATVIGVLEPEGKGTFGENNADESVIVPVNFIKNLVDIRREEASPQIWVKAKEGVPLNQVEDEIEFILRGQRRLKPMDDNNFSLNQTSLITNQIEPVFRMIKIAGLFIGIFSIIVGGFGIANIMFVSVKERTHIIGIEKALGAKKWFILLEFLIESIMLSLIGGITGLLIIGLISLVINTMGDFTLYLTMGNIMVGILISSIIGLLSGFAPAFQASRMDPVVAINTTF